jgi:hypothetical protein
MEIKRRHYDLADLGLGYGIAGAGPYDFQDQILVNDHAVARLVSKAIRPRSAVPNA